MSSVQNSLREAVVHHEAGRLDQALGLYRDVLQVVPEHPDALHLMGVLAHQRGAPAEAINWIHRAIRQREVVPEYHNNLGAALRAAGHLAQAAAAFSRAVSLRPQYAQAWFNLVSTWDEAGDAEGVSMALDGLIANCPEAAEAHHQRAAHRYAAGDITGAMADHAQVATLRADCPGPRLQQGLLAHEAGRDDVALEAFADGMARFHRTEDVGRSATRSKIDHDIEQIQWLVGQGLVPEQWLDRVAALQAVSSSLQGSEDLTVACRDLDSTQTDTIGAWFNRPVHPIDCPAETEGAINPHLAVTALTERYRAQDPGVTWVDDLLRPKALEKLRHHCLGSTMWSDFKYTGGYVGTDLLRGFANGLLLQIARELREALPDLLGEHPLRQMWAYKYDARLRGITPHADAAAVNVNFWITPDSANLDPNTGGLVVWREEAPLDWDFEAFNRQPERLMQWVREQGAERMEIPYRSNRAVIFNSNLIHRTGDLDFAPGYENRRINITLLYGERGRSSGDD